MENKKKNALLICFIIACIIIIGLVIYIIVSNNSNRLQSEAKSSILIDEELIKNIRVDEDFMLDKEVRGLKNVKLKNTKMSQYNGEIEVRSTLINESEDKKVGKTKLKVSLLDKEGKVVTKKEISIEKIDAGDYANIDFSTKLEDYEIIYDVQIEAK